MTCSSRKLAPAFLCIRCQGKDDCIRNQGMPHPVSHNDLLPSSIRTILHQPWQGKDDCIRKAYRGVHIMADLARSCPALSLQQVRLSASAVGLQCLLRHTLWHALWHAPALHPIIRLRSRFPPGRLPEQAPGFDWLVSA